MQIWTNIKSSFIWAIDRIMHILFWMMGHYAPTCIRVAEIIDGLFPP